MRFGRDVEVRPLGGSLGCLAMALVSIVFSLVVSVVLTIVLNS